jgi:hypothetical protein
MRRIKSLFSRKTSYYQLDLFEPILPVLPPPNNTRKKKFFVLFLVASFSLGMGLPFALSAKELPAKIRFINATEGINSFSAKLTGDYTYLQKITGFSPSTIQSLTLHFTTGTSNISILSAGSKTLLATKRDNQGISLSMSDDFWELSSTLKQWNQENIKGESVDPKVKDLFSEQWLNIGYLPERSLKANDFITTQNGVEFTTSLATLEHLSNIDIILHFLATITKSQITYDPQTVFIIKSKITKSSLDSLTLSLAPLGFGNLNFVVIPEKNIKEVWQLRPTRIISQEYSQSNEISKSVDSALASILSNAQDIAIIKRTTLSPEILIQSFNEISKDIDKSYTLSQSGGVMLSTKTQCRELIVLDAKPIFTDC